MVCGTHIANMNTGARYRLQSLINSTAYTASNTTGAAYQPQKDYVMQNQITGSMKSHDYKQSSYLSKETELPVFAAYQSGQIQAGYNPSLGTGFYNPSANDDQKSKFGPKKAREFNSSVMNAVRPKIVNEANNSSLESIANSSPKYISVNRQNDYSSAGAPNKMYDTSIHSFGDTNTIESISSAVESAACTYDTTAGMNTAKRAVDNMSDSNIHAFLEQIQADKKKLTRVMRI